MLFAIVTGQSRDLNVELGKIFLLKGVCRSDCLRNFASDLDVEFALSLQTDLVLASELVDQQILELVAFAALVCVGTSGRR